MSDTVCGYCTVEMCFMCVDPGAVTDSHECCCEGTHGRVTLGNFLTGDKRPVGRPMIDDGADMKDPVSAGRRRAANIAKIPEDYLCEWSMLEFAGGGPVPIVGCAGNTAVDLHHGPDKSTLNNEVGINLHRICKNCHNRWHELNDKHYGPDRPSDNNVWLPLAEQECEPHDRHTIADSVTVRASDNWWAAGTRSDRPGYREWKLAGAVR